MVQTARHPLAGAVVAAAHTLQSPILRTSRQVILSLFKSVRQAGGPVRAAIAGSRTTPRQSFSAREPEPMASIPAPVAAAAAVQVATQRIPSVQPNSRAEPAADRPVLVVEEVARLAHRAQANRVQHRMPLQMSAARAAAARTEEARPLDRGRTQRTAAMAVMAMPDRVTASDRQRRALTQEPERTAAGAVAALS
jgi:hypothetical protein